MSFSLLSAAPTALSPQEQRPRLLVVDDLPLNVQILNQLFRHEYEISMATNGSEALEFCDRRPLPDLILLDVVMPGMDGLEVCRRLQRNPITADIPVIFVTAQSSAAQETAALEAGGVDFISKPFVPAVVRARVRTHLTLKAQRDQLRDLAFVDGLTGIANRRRFDETLDIAWRNACRSGESLALMLMDIDQFKAYNDHYGHPSGDECLQTVARLLPPLLKRPRDLAARYGGEEFACLLPGCALEGALAKAHEIVHTVNTLRLPHATSRVAPHVTLSVGVAACQPQHGEPALQLLQASDAALYQAKSAGRNRVVSAEASVQQQITLLQQLPQMA